MTFSRTLESCLFAMYFQKVRMKNVKSAVCGGDTHHTCTAARGAVARGVERGEREYTNGTRQHTPHSIAVKSLAQSAEFRVKTQESLRFRHWLRLIYGRAPLRSFARGCDASLSPLIHEDKSVSTLQHDAIAVANRPLHTAARFVTAASTSHTRDKSVSTLQHDAIAAANRPFR